MTKATTIECNISISRSRSFGFKKKMLMVYDHGLRRFDLSEGQSTCRQNHRRPLATMRKKSVMPIKMTVLINSIEPQHCVSKMIIKGLQSTSSWRYSIHITSEDLVNYLGWSCQSQILVMLVTAVWPNTRAWSHAGFLPYSKLGLMLIRLLLLRWHHGIGTNLTVSVL